MAKYKRQTYQPSFTVDDLYKVRQEARELLRNDPTLSPAMAMGKASERYWIKQITKQ